MDSIVDVPGILVGHHTDLQGATGCTVVLCDLPMVGGCFMAGAAPGTRETALLDPTCLVDEVHAILLSGGSAFGLDAAGGVMQYLEEKERGFATSAARVPIVPAAILYDLAIGSAMIRPGRADGYRACLAASFDERSEGNVGAGTGATVGKLVGRSQAVKGGLGGASLRLPGGVMLGALVAVNCAGDVVDPATGRIVAGARRSDGRGFADSSRRMMSGGDHRVCPGINTTLAVVATDAYLTKAHTSRFAQLAYQGLARSIRPITVFDGDVVFSLASSRPRGMEADLSVLGAAAAEALARAVLRGVAAAESLGGYPSARDVMGADG